MNDTETAVNNWHHAVTKAELAGASLAQDILNGWPHDFLKRNAQRVVAAHQEADRAYNAIHAAGGNTMSTANDVQENPPRVLCPHWSPGRLTPRKGCTACQASPPVTHWVGDAPTSLHGNGASSFEHATRDQAAVTCKLCLALLAAHTGGSDR
jgi:hypothetical protein